MVLCRLPAGKTGSENITPFPEMYSDPVLSLSLPPYSLKQQQRLKAIECLFVLVTVFKGLLCRDRRDTRQGWQGWGLSGGYGLAPPLAVVRGGHGREGWGQGGRARARAWLYKVIKGYRRTFSG